MTAGLCLPVVMIAWALQFLDLAGSKANEITFSQENTQKMEIMTIKDKNKNPFIS